MEKDIKELLDIILGIDIKLFKTQRISLVKILNDKKLTPTRLNSIEGILNFTDYIYDWILDHPDTIKQLIFEKKL